MAEASVLVLNRGFAALALTGVRRTFALLYKGQVRVVLPDYTTFAFEEWRDVGVQPGDEVIHTPSAVFRIPRVIQFPLCESLPRHDVKFSRHNIYVRDGNRCQYCYKKFPTSELSLDHVIPLSRGGPSTWENVVCACLTCNVRKGNRLLGEVGLRLHRPPVKPKGSPLGLLAPGRIHPAWRNFLDIAYWNVELG